MNQLFYNYEILRLLLPTTHGITMNCPNCGNAAKFVRDRGFADGSGMTFTCSDSKCKSHSLYFYPKLNGNGLPCPTISRPHTVSLGRRIL